MKIRVNPHTVEIVKEQTEPINEREIKVSKCEFEFDEAITSDFVKEAYFTLNGNTYKMIVENNECDYPSEVLVQKGTLEIGVVAFLVENEEEIKRYNPSPDYFESWVGSLKDAENSEPITPSEMEQFEQELQEGLNEIDDKIDEVDDKIEEVNTAITETNNLDLDVDKVGKVATVTLTKKDASTKVVTLSDGTSLMFNWQGTSLGIKTDEDADYTYVDLQGIQGVPGPKGDAFQIKKTYPTVEAMNADFNNMELGDYVMIASEVSIEDNAKLYTRGQNAWIFISDFSGSQGIKGETGATPNIQIGTVTSGSTPSVTRTGTNENPVLNFVLQPGQQGQPGQTGATGNGIASITKTSTSGLVDTYTITFTSGNTTTFNVTNGNGIDHISLTSQSGATKVYTIYFTDGNTTTFTVEDGEVTQEVFDEEIERANMIYNAMPKVSDEDTEFSLNNTAECPVYDIELSPSELEQETTQGLNKFNPNWVTYRTNNGITATLENDHILLNGTATASAYINYTVPSGTFEDESYTWFAKSDTTLQYGIKVLRSEGGSIDISPTINWVKSTFNSSKVTGGYIYVANGTTLTNCKVYIDVRKGNIDIGNFKYEPYTGGQPSPNPSYPQQIHTVSGENSVKVGNKNLLDTSYLVEANADKSLANLGFWAFKLNEELTTFTLSRENNTMYYDGSYLAIGQGTDLATANSNKVWLMHPSVQSLNVQSRTLTNTGELWLFTGNNSTNISNMLTRAEYLQLEKNSQATTYVPHQEQTYPISLGDLEYCKIGDYEDEFYKATESDTGLTAGKWYLKKNTGKTNDTIGSTSKTISDMVSNATVYSYCGGTVSGTTITYTSALVVANYIYYPTTTPTYTLLSDTLQTQLDNIQKAISYQDQTNVSQTNNDLPFVIKLSAIRDLSGIFEEI